MKAIIFDLDETLVDRTSTVRRFLGDQYDRYSDQLSCEKDTFVATVLKHQKNGYCDKLIAYQDSCSELGESISGALYDDSRLGYGSEAITFPGVLKALEELSTNYALAIITNGSSLVQNAKIDACGFRHLFETIKISEEEGIKKPDKDIYMRCLTDLGLSASDCLFIGDNPEFDVIVPKKMGMNAVWVRSSHYQEPNEADAVVESAAELPSLLRESKMPNRTLQSTRASGAD